MVRPPAANMGGDEFAAINGPNQASGSAEQQGVISTWQYAPLSPGAAGRK